MRAHRMDAWADRAVWGLTGLAAVLVWAVSRSTAPAFDELGYLAEVERCFDAVRAVADRGLGALLSPDMQAAIAGRGATSPLEDLLGAWSRLSVGRVGLLDPLTSSRLPSLLLGLMAPVALYALGRPSLGRRAAAMAAALLAVDPGWLHGCAVRAEGARVGSLWVIVLAAHQAICGRSARVGLAWAGVCGLLFALGVALSEAALWVLPLLLTHYWVRHHWSLRRLIGQARWPVPPSAVVCACFAPLGAWALNPALWKKSAAGVLRWWLEPLSSPGLGAELSGWRGLGHSVGAVLTTSPVLALLGAVGLGAIVHRSLGRRFASGRLRPRRDRYALGSLLVLGLGFALVLPVWLPRVLSPSALRVEASLPFLALAAGWGLDAVARSAGERREPWVLAGGAALAVIGLVTTRFSTMATDGSELGALGPAIDRLGASEVTIDAPGVSTAYWHALAAGGRIHALVTAARPGQTPDLVLRRGAEAPGEPMASVTQRGTKSWTLSRR